MVKGARCSLGRYPGRSGAWGEALFAIDIKIDSVRNDDDGIILWNRMIYKVNFIIK